MSELQGPDRDRERAGEPLVRCLMVETGYEQIVTRLLAVCGLGRTLYPQRVRIRKIRGVWHRDRVRLLPGYVFVYTDGETPVQSYQKIEHVLKVLRYDREPDGYLKGMDLDFASRISELDGKLDILDAVDEEGFVRVTDRLLQTLQGEVLSVDRRKRLVKIRIHLMGMTRIVYMNYQLLGEDGNPLTPAEEMVDDESDEWLTAFTPDFSDALAEELDLEAEREEDGNPGSDPDPAGTEGEDTPEGEPREDVNPGNDADPDGPEREDMPEVDDPEEAAAEPEEGKEKT